MTSLIPFQGLTGHHVAGEYVELAASEYPGGLQHPRHGHDPGSAAETFALMFQERRLGTIVGRTTVGGGIGGALYYQRLSDGGRVVIPLRASYNSRLGIWGVENGGVVPEVTVRQTQADAVAGRDPQLERAIDIALRGLASFRPTVARRPTMPVHPPRDP